MARSVATIQASILANMAANPALTYTDSNGNTQNITNNTSMFAIFNALAFVVATAQAVLEQLMDLYLARMEAVVDRSSAANSLWIQDKMFKFQYSVSNPQIVQLINGVTQYPVVDPTLQIITACAVSVDTSNTVNIKTAIGNPLSAMDSQQLAAAQSYINLIATDGINYNVISLSPDRIYIAADVFYNGMYSSTMQATLITAITNYFQVLSITRFDGSLLMSDLEGLIRSVPGVNDVVLKTVRARPNAVAYPGGTPLITNQTVVSRNYTSNANNAGYMIPEDTAGGTLADSLNLIAE